MALIFLERPLGQRVDTTPNTSYSIPAPFDRLKGGSGLFDEQYIYLKDLYTTYNGFWKLAEGSPNEFFLGNPATQSGLETYRAINNVPVYPSVGEVKASCVHLPIIYRIKNNLWPINNEPQILVDIVNNDNGYVQLTLNSAYTINVFDWFYVFTGDPDIDGPYQIIGKLTTNIFTINCPWDTVATSPYSFLGGFVQKYYNNYRIVVRVQAGLTASHQYSVFKQYALIATKVIAPDAEGRIAVNIADELKEKLTIQSNHPDATTIPFDLDRFCQFAIETQEQYDQSDGATVTTYRSPVISDISNFEGVAVDAKLGFKNKYSGFLSDYTYINTSFRAAFLSDGTPTLFYGYYMDLSFIFKSTPNPDLLRIVVDSYDAADVLINAGNVVDVATFDPAQPSDGVLRVTMPTQAQVGDNIAYITLTAGVVDVNLGQVMMTEAKRINIFSGCVDQSIYLTWKNHLGGFNYWLFTSNKDYGVNILETQQRDVDYLTNWPTSYGENADTITQETYRSSVNQITVRAENLTSEDADFIAGIKVSSLVQIMESQFNRRTVLVDVSSFRKRTDNEKMHSIEFTIRYTDLLPSQSL